MIAWTLCSGDLLRYHRFVNGIAICNPSLEQSDNPIYRKETIRGVQEAIMLTPSFTACPTCVELEAIQGRDDLLCEEIGTAHCRICHGAFVRYQPSCGHWVGCPEC